MSYTWAEHVASMRALDDSLRSKLITKTQYVMELKELRRKRKAARSAEQQNAVTKARAQRNRQQILEEVVDVDFSE